MVHRTGALLRMIRCRETGGTRSLGPEGGECLCEETMIQMVKDKFHGMISFPRPNRRKDMT